MNRHHPYINARKNKLSIKFKKDVQQEHNEETIINGEESPLDKLNPLNKLNSFFNFISKLMLIQIV